MKTILLILGLVLLSFPAMAGGRIALGPEVGFSFQGQRDSGGKTLGWSAGIPFGLAGVYQFGGDLSHLAIDYSVGYSTMSRYTIRNVTLGAVTGTYRENLGIFHWLFGARYYFLNQKFRPYAGLDFGFQYFRRSNVEFRDQFNTVVPLAGTTNHFNMAVVPQGGIEYRPTFRWAIGVGLRLPMAIRRSGIVPGFQLPVTVQVAF